MLDEPPVYQLLLDGSDWSAWEARREIELKPFRKEKEPGLSLERGAYSLPVPATACRSCGKTFLIPHIRWYRNGLGTKKDAPAL